MISENLKIEIRPIPNRSEIKKFSDNLEYFSQAHTIAPFVDPVSLKYRTGLAKEDIEWLKEEGFPYDLSNNYQRGKAHEFWESAMVKMELKNSPSFLHPGKSHIDFVKWKYLLVNNYIYKSEQEMLTGVKTQATHYIYNESEENAIKATRLETRNALISKVAKLSLQRKRDLLIVIENESTENKNEDYLTVKFDEIIKDNAKANVLNELLSNNVEELVLTADIKRAIHKNVLRKTKEGIFLFETNLGFSEEDVRTFLTKPENQEILLTIKQKIN